TPDIVFTTERVAIFLDGDFWHGYRFPQWERTLSPFWRRKIAANRERDRRNFRRLRRLGWRVIRIWQHASRADLDGVVARITAAVGRQPGPTPVSSLKLAEREREFRPGQRVERVAG